MGVTESEWRSPGDNTGTGPSTSDAADRSTSPQRPASSGQPPQSAHPVDHGGQPGQSGHPTSGSPNGRPAPQFAPPGPPPPVHRPVSFAPPGPHPPRPAPPGHFAPIDQPGAPKAWPGAMGPPVIGPPPRVSARPPHLTPAAQMGAWQGALRPPVFVVSQPRPTFREPLPVRSGMVWAGAAVAAAWMLLFGLQAGTAGAYVWLTLVAGLLAGVTAAVLARFGDRGVAVGVALSGGIGVAIAGALLCYRLAGGDWLLW